MRQIFSGVSKRESFVTAVDSYGFGTEFIARTLITFCLILYGRSAGRTMNTAKDKPMIKPAIRNNMNGTGE